MIDLQTYPSVLTIAGFDSSGGAGIQADIKTISALGCYATCALTALPIQNTTGVKNIYPIDYKSVKEQISVVFDDILPCAIKIGMVHNCQLVDIIVETLKQYPPVPVVFDPVMISTSGHKLIEDKTIDYIVEKLFPIAYVITPNLDEASVLSGISIKTTDQMLEAGKKIMKLGVNALLLKGGHLQGDTITSLFFQGDEVYTFTFEKYATKNTHGSGCTLSSAIAAYIAKGHTLLSAVTEAQNYVQKAIFYGKDITIGKGSGPLNHFFDPIPMAVIKK